MTRLSIAVLTEDSSSDAYDVLHCLLRAMLKLVAETAAVYDKGPIALTPAAEAQRKAMRGNMWQAKTSRTERILIQRYIEGQLVRKDTAGFVVVHLDGDRPYCKSKSGSESHNQARFEKDILSKVRESFKNQPDILAKIILLVPFYSIESWLFQNTEAALALYERHYRTHEKDIAQFKTWQQDPSLLDEVEKPKETVSIKAKHNLDLAQNAFPAGKLDAVEKSFHQSVNRLRSSFPLVAALAAVKPSHPARHRSTD